VFGAAIRAATKPRDERDAADPSMVSPTAGTPISAPTIATAAAQQAPLDVRQERWPHAMIERIEILRDAADAGDTRIRLVPDALGAIDVSLKQDGDTVHVHFHAEQGATRALLQEAQPRLVELAEARGLKLGQGGLGDNASAGNGQPRAQATPQASNRTPSPPASATIVAAPEDIRIA
jgi:flagellar hook-length control protein FliK